MCGTQGNDLGASWNFIASCAHEWRGAVNQTENPMVIKQWEFGYTTRKATNTHRDSSWGWGVWKMDKEGKSRGVAAIVLRSAAVTGVEVCPTSFPLLSFPSKREIHWIFEGASPKRHMEKSVHGAQRWTVADRGVHCLDCHLRKSKRGSCRSTVSWESPVQRLWDLPQCLSYDHPFLGLPANGWAHYSHVCPMRDSSNM